MTGIGQSRSPSRVSVLVKTLIHIYHFPAEHRATSSFVVHDYQHVTT